MKIAVLGLGEAGSAFARDLLKQGVQVSGWDPEPNVLPEGLELASSNAEAAKDADIILSANLASAALDIASEVSSVLGPNQYFAEMNTSSPQLKRDVANALDLSGAKVLDVAIMAPVPPQGLATPMYVAGEGTEEFVSMVRPLGMSTTVLDGGVGTAATYKLVRSIAYKGFAAVVTECLEAAQKLNLEAYAREQLAGLIGDEKMIDRFVVGSKKHAKRRKHEMEAVKDLLKNIDVSAFTTEASINRLKELGG